MATKWSVILNRIDNALQKAPWKEWRAAVVDSSSGPADAGSIPMLGPDGQLDPSMVTGSGSNIELKTDGVINPVQDVLNLVEGTNIALVAGVAGDVTISATGNLATSFDNIDTGTNTTATMTVGSGASITPVNSGVINATEINGIPITGTLTHAGQIPISQPDNASAVWADPLVQGLQAEGTTASTVNPVLVGGKDGSGNLADLVLDSSGRVGVNVNGTVPISGTFWQATQPVSGDVSVSNFPSSQAVTGTFWQATQPVSGTVAVSNQPPLTFDGSGNLNCNVVVGGGSSNVSIISPLDGSGYVEVDVKTDVTLASGTVTALTPPTAAAIGTAVATDLLIGTAVAGSSVPVALPTATITTLTPPSASAIASAIVSDPPTVDIKSTTVTALTPPSASAIASAIVSDPPTVDIKSTTVTTLTPPTAAAIGSAVAAPSAIAIASAIVSNPPTVDIKSTTVTTLTPPTASAIASAIVSNPPTVPLASTTITSLTPPTAAAIGSAVAGALTNPLPVSGNQGSAASASGAWPVYETVSGSAIDPRIGPVQTGNAPTAATVGITSATALASNTSRTAVILTNTSGAVIYLGFGANAAVVGSGVPLFPYGSLSLNVHDNVQQAINAIATVASSNLAIQEFN